MERNTIICGDALDVMRGMDNESVDLVVTSPPYNIRNSTGGGFRSTETRPGKWRAELRNGYGDLADDMPHDEYVEWQRKILLECYRLIPTDGAIFYNHKWRVQNGLYQRLAEDIVHGFPLRQIIIWQRSGGVNFNQQYYLPTYEVIYLIAKPDFVLVDGANGYGDVWTIPQESSNPHPAPFPIEIPYRCIASTDAQLVFDPFMGSGTTALAAKQLGRDYIGIEISEKYVRMTNERLYAPAAPKEKREDAPKTLKMFE